MDVDQLSFPAANETIGQDAHEAGQDHDLRIRRAQGRIDLGVESFAALVLVGNELGGNAGCLCAVQAGGAFDIGNDPNDLVAVACRLDQRAEIAAASGDQNGDALQRFKAPR